MIPKEKHILFIPIRGLTIGQEFGGEFSIEQVRFISSSKIPRIRKRLGLKRCISEYQGWVDRGIPRKLFSESDTYALVYSMRDPSIKDYKNELRRAGDAFFIMVSSMLETTPRGLYSIAFVPQHGNRSFEQMIVFNVNSDTFTTKRRGYSGYIPFVLDRKWRNQSKKRHLFDLIKILKGNPPVKSEWKHNIRRAAILAGKSHLSNHLAEAFIYDMIAIETLLSRRGDSFPDALIKRIVALFGWMTGEDPSTWESVVKRLYQLRCSYVHDGKFGDITGMDLFEADTLLSNLLLNICKNARHIQSKQDIVDLAERLRARKVLGLKPVRRPWNLKFIHKIATSAFEDRTNDVSRWSW